MPKFSLSSKLPKSKNARTEAMQAAQAANALGAPSGSPEIIVAKENPILKQLKAISPREKYLLLGLLAVIIVLVLVVLLIMPATERLDAANASLQETREKRATTDMEIASISSYQTSLEASQARYEGALAKYQVPMQPEDIDRMITTLVEEIGFEAMSLTMQPMTSEGVAEFVIVPPAWVVSTPPANSTVADSGGASTGTNANSGNASTDASSAGIGADGAANANSGATDGSTSGNSDTGTTAGTTVGTTGSGTSGSNNPIPSPNPSSSGSGSNSNTPSASGGANAEVYMVQISVTGTEANFFVFLDRVVPLTWLKVISTSYTPAATLVNTSANGSDEQTYSISLKIYVNPNATAKTP